MSNSTDRRAARPRVLVVDDEPLLRELALTYLEQEGIAARAEATAEDGLQAFRSASSDLVLVDLMLPGKDGIWLLDEIVRSGSDAKVILTTGYAGADKAVTAMRGGAFDYMVKPVKAIEFKMKVREALRALEMERAAREQEELARRRNQELATLHAVNTVVNESLQLEPVLAAALERLHGILELSAAFFWVDGEKALSELFVSRGVDDAAAAAARKACRRHAATVARRGERRAVEWARKRGLQDGWLVAPLSHGGRCYGLFGCRPAKTPSDREAFRVLLSAVGRQVGNAASNAASYARERRLATQLQTINEVSGEILRTREPNLTAEMILQSAAHMLDLDRGVALAVVDGVYPVVATLNTDADIIEADASAWSSMVAGWLRAWRDAPSRYAYLSDLAAAGAANRLGQLAMGSRCLLALGLAARDEVQGLLVLGHSSKVAPCDEDDLKAILTFADLAAVAVDNSRLFERMERQVFEEQYALLDVSTSLLGVLELESACEIVMRAAVRTLKSDGCSIYLLEAEGQDLQLAATTFPDAGRRSIAGYGGTAVTYAVENRLPVAVSDTAREPRFGGLEAAATAGLRAQLVVPMLRGEEAVGAIALFWRTGREFAPREIRMASLLGHQAALGAAQARLYERVHRAQTELASANTELKDAYLRLTRHADALEGANRIITESIQRLDAEELYRGASELALRTVGAETASVVAMVGDRRRIWSASAHGVSYSPREELLEQILAGAARSGRPVRVPPRGDEPALLAVPMAEAGRLVGLLVVTGSTSRAFSREEVKLLSSLASQTVLAARNIGLYRDLEAAYDATLGALVSALDVRDRETENHSQRVMKLSLGVGAYLGYVPDSPEWVELKRGALLHDIGKIGVSDGILRKEGPLTEREWEEMRKHPEYGFKLLQNVPFLAGAAEIMYCHHERWDGGGYPRNLRGEEIPLGARIFAVVDAFDAMVTNRPYRRARPYVMAVRELVRCSATQFDPRVVVAFQQFFARLRPEEIYADMDIPGTGLAIVA